MTHISERERESRDKIHLECVCVREECMRVCVCERVREREMKNLT